MENEKREKRVGINDYRSYAGVCVLRRKNCAAYNIYVYRTERHDRADIGTVEALRRI